jgi:hypothetical protein
LLPIFPIPQQNLVGYSACYDLPPDWSEIRSKYFAIISPVTTEAPVISPSILDEMDREYRNFSTWFNAELPTPINLRLYPKEDHFYCLNVDAPQYPKGFSHAHIGDREISLIQKNLPGETKELEIEIINALHYELGVLFTSQLSGQKAPVGLKEAVGAYLVNPEDMVSPLVQFYPMRDQLANWRQLWESQDYGDKENVFRLQAISTVAFLTDVYGWPSFRDFLKALSTSDNYLDALRKIYSTNVNDLQEKWDQYFPYYKEGRWRAHALYSFDLSAFNDLLEAGAYSDAVDGIKNAITYLESIRETNPDAAVKLEQARQMLIRAQQGQEAAALIRQARQALVKGEYQACLDLVESSRQIYQGLGDSRHFLELDQYQSWAEEVLQLRNELDELITKNPTQTSISDQARMTEIGSRLAELGDAHRAEIVNAYFDTQKANQKDEFSSTRWVAFLASLPLLLALFLMIRLRRRPETLL